MNCASPGTRLRAANPARRCSLLTYGTLKSAVFVLAETLHDQTTTDFKVESWPRAFYSGPKSCVRASSRRTLIDAAAKCAT
jgi:hypothetical protein